MTSARGATGRVAPPLAVEFPTYLFGTNVARYDVMKVLLFLVVASTFVAASVAEAGGRGRLTAKQKTSVRKEIRASFLQTSARYKRNGRKPKIETTFTAKGSRVQVNANLTAIWRGKREIISSQRGVVEKLPGGQWRFRNGRDNDLVTPKNAIDAIRLRRPGRIRSAVVAKNKKTTTVLHFEPDTGDKIFLSKVSNTGRREIVETSRNLASSIKKAALKAHGKERGERTSISFQRLAKNGRSIQVEIYSTVSHGPAQWSTTYTVKLDKTGKPTTVSTPKAERQYL